MEISTCISTGVTTPVELWQTIFYYTKLSMVLMWSMFLSSCKIGHAQLYFQQSENLMQEYKLQSSQTSGFQHLPLKYLGVFFKLQLSYLSKQHWFYF